MRFLVEQALFFQPNSDLEAEESRAFQNFLCAFLLKAKIEFMGRIYMLIAYKIISVVSVYIFII